MSNSEQVGGIDITQLENFDKYKNLVDELKCPLCLKVVCDPLECKDCQTLLCKNCYFLLQMEEEKCVSENCKGNYSRANKYVREILDAFKIKCISCGQKNMNYSDYLKHIDTCKEYLSNKLNKIIRDIKEKNAQIKDLEEQVKKASFQPLQLTQDQIRKKLMSSTLPVVNKMELYNACIEGKLNEFANLVQNKKYPILEEISARNYGWTSLHYAMHYGKWEIIKFILDYLKSQGILELAMLLQSSDRRTPLLCLLRSNSLNIEKKSDLFSKIVSIYNIKVPKEIEDELKKRINSSQINN